MKRLISQRGIALAYALVGLSFVSILLYFLASTVLLLSKQSQRKLNLTEGRMVVYSLLDYTIYGIKQRWCFDDNWLPAQDCKFEHPRSVERLVMNQDSEKVFNQMVDDRVIIGTIPNPVRLKRIESPEISLKNLLPAHPLQQIIGPIAATHDLATAKIVISHDPRVSLPNGGRHIFLRVDVEVKDTAGKVVLWQDLPMKGTSSLGVFPRELGSFTLIVGNDLHLDLAYNQQPSPGDASIHMFGSKSEVPPKTGIVFESPVFVNGNLILPDASSRSNADNPEYSPVTFVEKLFLGGGQVYRSGDRFKPKTAGSMEDQTWDGVLEIGGLNRGIEMDGGRDLGLDILSGRSRTNPPDETLVKQCLSLVGVKSNLSYSRNSHLAALNKGGELSTGVRFRLGMSDGNWITPQLGAPTIKSGSINAAPFLSGPKVKPIGSVKLQVGRTRAAATAIVGIGSKFSFEYRPGRNESKIDRLTKDFNKETDIGKKADLKKKIDYLEEVATRKGLLEVEVQGANINGADQPVFADFIVKANPVNAFVDDDGDPQEIFAIPDLFDVGCDKMSCDPRDKVKINLDGVKSKDYSRKGYLRFSGDKDGDPYRNPGKIASTIDGSDRYSDIADETFDWAGLEKACTFDTKMAFGGADWGINFSSSTEFVWHFAPGFPGKTRAENLNSTYVLDGGSSGKFHVVSRVGRCLIKADAERVAGFFNCDKLIVEGGRSKPLKIIGTFIVQGLEIAPQALQKGIRWASIYNAQSTYLLRNWGVLKPQATMTCGALGSPIWHPIPSLIEVANFSKCNTLSLRAKADPFTWTAVDPDCGLVPGKGNTICKNRVVKAVVQELSRETDL
jgi:hypothetical protein